MSIHCHAPCGPTHLFPVKKLPPHPQPAFTAVLTV